MIIFLFHSGMIVMFWCQSSRCSTIVDPDFLSILSHDTVSEPTASGGCWGDLTWHSHFFSTPLSLTFLVRGGNWCILCQVSSLTSCCGCKCAIEWIFYFSHPTTLSPFLDATLPVQVNSLVHHFYSRRIPFFVTCPA
jgi:hypothetical protein